MEAPMQTPDAIRGRRVSSQDEALVKCLGCNTLFRFRRGKKYHDAKCRYSHRAQSRQSILRVRKIRCSVDIDRLLSSAPYINLNRAIALSSEQIWLELSDVDGLLRRDGPVDAVLSESLRKRVACIVTQFDEQGRLSTEEQQQYAQAMGILTDVGATSRDGLPSLIGLSWSSADVFLRQRSYRQLARALVSVAMTYRLVKQERRAREIIRHAYNILMDHMDFSDHRDLCVLHCILTWEVRFHPDGQLGESKQSIKDRLIEVTEILDDPGASLSTTRDLGSYWLRMEPDKAIAQADELLKFDSGEYRVPRYVVLSLVRQAIQCYMAMNRLDQAIEVIRNRFVPEYNAGRHIHYFDHAMEWDTKYGLGLRNVLMSPSYGSPIQIFLPRAIV